MNQKISIILILLLAGLLIPSPAPAAWPDCTPDAVAGFTQEAPADYGANHLPEVVLGLPGSSSATVGSLDVVSLGTNGSITLEYTNSLIVDEPGPDFIVFENAFFCALPEDSADDYGVFAEPLIVEVSADGVVWKRYPFNPTELDKVGGEGCSPRSLLDSLTGLAGITPTFGGLNIVPDDPLVWDPDGVGGVSGWGGDAFDLARVGLAEAQYVRLIDSGQIAGFTGPTQGADVDAVVALHGRPAPPTAADSDGDGLSDADESIHHTDPLNPDTDGDGMADGIEAASCLCPLLAGDTLAGIDPEVMADPDRDGIANCYDNCPNAKNPAQTDADHDGVGDACEASADGGGSGGGSPGCSIAGPAAPAGPEAAALALAAPLLVMVVRARVGRSLGRRFRRRAG